MAMPPWEGGSGEARYGRGKVERGELGRGGEGKPTNQIGAELRRRMGDLVLALLER